MVVRRCFAWVGPLAIVLLGLSGCADFWKFQTLQDELGDAAAKGTVPVVTDAENGENPDVVVELDGSTCLSTSLCGGECRDLTSDLQNCGACGKHCLTSQVCQESACVCTANQTLCGTGAAQGCVDTMSDHNNCGGCGNVCAATTACQMGACVCPGTEKFCGSGPTATCSYVNSDHNNCGGCGNVCPMGGSCQSGPTGVSACACPTGQQTCGAGASAACVDTTTDNNNCGGCGTICPTSQTCSNSKCVPCASIGPTGIMCGTPLTCVNTATDHSNCGGCGEPCLATETCQAGACGCPAGEALCGSGAAEGCVTLASDQNNCSKCGLACVGGMICTNSVCVCPPSFHDCGGTCVPDNSMSTSSCGTTCSLCPTPVRGTASCGGTPPACGQSCAGSPNTPTLCNAGANATCVNTTNDIGNCGACGAACSTNHATPSCAGSKCTITACATGYADCDGNAANGCEIDTNTNVGSCGACGQPCNMNGGVEGCVGGKCTQPVCNAPNANCDGNAATGCEVDTATDKNNCGSCGHVCATGTNCTGGICSKCGAGTLLCGSVNGIGGTCATCPAAPTNGTLTCTATNTCMATCSNATLPNLCGSACVNTKTDDGNCGSCGSPCSLATQSNKCEQTYACQAGVCTGSNPVTCPAAPDACHTAGACAPATGACSAPTMLTGIACTGSNECDSYMCQAGVCTGTNDVTCSASNSCNTPGTCQPGTGTCTAQTPLTGGACTVANPNMCDTYSCVSGTCTGTSAVACTASDGCHTVGACNPMTGICSNPIATPGTPCDGSNLCLSYACNASGVCTATGANGTCTPVDQCHSAACSSTTGMCVNTPVANGTLCNDGNACTQTDTCQAGTCTGMNPVMCSALDACHVAGTCDPGTGMCSNPPVNDGTTCTGTNGCETYACQSGVCTGTSACAALDQCHVAGVCVLGTCTNPNITDGTPCAGAASGMMCEGGACQCPPSDPTPCPSSGGMACVNTNSDSSNCGMCNMVCGVPEAGGSPSCSAGMCVE
jgi:hypothetical protein